LSPKGLKKLVLIDTSIWIGFFSKTGYPQIKEHLKRLLDNNVVATAGPIVLELLQGCRSPKERRILREQLEGIHWLATEDQHWFLAGEMANDLRQKGITVSAIDALIATLAQAYRCQLMNLDQDYEHIAKHTDLSLFKIVSA
jgi:predicted nucleic acid-binding protein